LKDVVELALGICPFGVEDVIRSGIGPSAFHPSFDRGPRGIGMQGISLAAFSMAFATGVCVARLSNVLIAGFFKTKPASLLTLTAGIRPRLILTRVLRKETRPKSTLTLLTEMLIHWFAISKLPVAFAEMRPVVVLACVDAVPDALRRMPHAPTLALADPVIVTETATSASMPTFTEFPREKDALRKFVTLELFNPDILFKFTE
jgi:hypothetical protein